MSWQESAPHEEEAGERSWDVVREAFEQRIPSPRRRDRRPLVAVAVAAGVLAAAATPPGQAVWSSIRDAVRTEDHLLSLPADGRVLVNSQSGAWVIQRNGSKRLLSGYIDAAWSPHGLYIAAARGNDLVALEPNGRVHWKLPQTHPIGGPQWSYEGYRIAYLSGRALRIVNGDGSGDRLLDPAAVRFGLPALAWRPQTHELAYKTGRDELMLRDADTGRVLWRRHAKGIEQLLWSDDGQRLLVAGGPHRILDAHGRAVVTLPDRSLLPAAFAPRSQALALVTTANGQSTVSIYSGPRYAHRRVVFAGANGFGGLAWSPDGKWLLIDWRTADQWIFIRFPSVRRIAVRNIGNSFDSGPEHFATLAGWCCP
jgi:dipeptidyl aminopeptidase/acylaminoacyl peptidase